MSRGGALAALGVLLAGACAAVLASPQDRFTVDVDLVLLHLSVLDRQGAPVRGLSAADLELRVDGKPRAISIIYPVQFGSRQPAPPAPEAGRREPLGSPASPAASPVVPVRRRFLIFLDFTFTRGWSITRAKRAVDVFLDEQARPGDLVGIAGYNMVSGLAFLSPFSSDHDFVRRALARIRPAGSEALPRTVRTDDLESLVTFGQGPGQAIDSSNELTLQLEQEYEEGSVVGFLYGLEELGRTLQPLAGQTNVLLFSHGFVDAAFQYPEVRAAAKQAATSLRAANAVIYTFDPEILRPPDVHDVRSMASRLRLDDIGNSIGRILVNREALYYLSHETGGSATWYKHNLLKGLAAVDARTAFAYVVGFRRLPGDPETIQVDVSARDPELSVPGMPRPVRVPLPYSRWVPEARRLQLAEALEPGADLNGFAVSLRAAPSERAGERGFVRVFAELSADTLRALATQGNTGDTLRLELLLLLRTQEGDLVDVVKTGLRLPVPPGNPDTVATAPALQYFDRLRAPPGEYELRFVARDAASGRIAARTVPVAVAGPCQQPLCVALPQIVGTTGSVHQVRPSTRRADASLEAAYPWRFGEREYIPSAAPTLLAGRDAAVLTSIETGTPGNALPSSMPADSCRATLVSAAGTDLQRHSLTARLVALADLPGHPDLRRILLQVMIPAGTSGTYDLGVKCMIAGRAGRSPTTRVRVVANVASPVGQG